MYVVLFQFGIDFFGIRRCAGGHIHNERTGLTILADALLTTQQALHMRAVGQHSDNHVAVLGDLAGVLRHGDTKVSRFFQARFIQIRNQQIIAGLFQILRHWSTHNTQADETDLTHNAFSFSKFIVAIPR